MSEVFSSVPEFVAKPRQAPQPCQFCQQFPHYAPLEEMENHGVKVFFCHPCRAEYLCWDDNNTYSSVSIYTEIQNRIYRWTRWTNTAKGAAQLWLIKNPGVPGTRRNQNLESVMYLEKDIPDITPDNIKEKIKTWLLFL
jgi:hypothetical protein